MQPSRTEIFWALVVAACAVALTALYSEVHSALWRDTGIASVVLPVALALPVLLGHALAYLSLRIAAGAPPRSAAVGTVALATIVTAGAVAHTYVATRPASVFRAYVAPEIPAGVANIELIERDTFVRSSSVEVRFDAPEDLLRDLALSRGYAVSAATGPAYERTDRESNVVVTQTLAMDAAGRVTYLQRTRLDD